MDSPLKKNPPLVLIRL